MKSCLGIFRETQNSPGRESDDALILRAVLEQLTSLKFDAQAMTPEEADRSDLHSWDLLVPMCEAYPRLMRLKSLGGQGAAVPGGGGGPLIINRPASVLACYRTEMLRRFSGRRGLGFPETELHAVTGSGGLPEPAFGLRDGAWVKRGDVHNTTTRDVVHCRTPADIEAARRDFERREIAHLLVQRHIDGDLVKFYGVGPGRWFTWFYHDPSTARRISFAIDDLASLTAAGAALLDLEVFGGDAIISSEGSLHLIDINSWPSFARVRDEASRQIAWHLTSRVAPFQKFQEGAVPGGGGQPR